MSMFRQMAGCLAAFGLSACNVSYESQAPEDATRAISREDAERQFVASVRRRITAYPEALVTNIEFASDNFFLGCGYVHVDDRAPFAFASIDRDTSDGERPMSGPVLRRIEDLNFPANRQMSDFALRTCRRAGLLLDLDEPPAVSSQ